MNRIWGTRDGKKMEDRGRSGGNERRHRTDGSKKRIAAVALACFMALTILMPGTVQTAKAEDTFGYVVVYDENAELYGIGVAFSAGSDTYVILPVTGNSDPTQLILPGEEREYYEIDLAGYICNGSMSLWVTDDEAARSESYVLSVAYPIANQTVTAIYFNANSDLTNYEARLIQYEEIDTGWLLGLDEAIPDLAYIPAPLFDSNGYCVGFLCGTMLGYTLVFNEEVYNSGAGSTDTGRETETQENGGGGTKPQESGVGSEDRNPSEEAPVTADPTEPVRENDNTALIGVIAAVAAAAAAFMVLRKKQKPKKAESAPIPAQIPDPISDPIPTEPFPYSPVPDPIPPIPPAPASPTETGLWLACSGGYMDGRIYPIGDTPITIGRGNPSRLVICYPGDTPGVSRNHARLYQEHGKLMLMDCNSTNGTYVKNHGKLVPMQPKELSVGDVFYIGEKKNRFEIKD